MEFFEETIQGKISHFWQNFRAEIILIFISLTIMIASLTIFIKANSSEEGKISFEDEKKDQISNFKFSVSKKIYIDLSGAVEKPDVYEVTSGARLKDILILAGGLSADADRQFFARNFNLARILVDQEKIYIPSSWEVAQGFFQEQPILVDQIQPRVVINNRVETSRQDISAENKININTASAEELDNLPGVGKTTAQKIIDNRPYNSVEELLTKKVVNKSVYEKIRNLIEL